MLFDAKNHEEFFDDIQQDGFHIFSRRHAQSAGYYPSAFPAYPHLQISDVHVGDQITVRVFFAANKAAMPRIDSGHLKLEVEFVDHDAKTLFGVILTELPAKFSLGRGTTIELDLDEVLSVQRP
jgi:hypothetical protein